MTSGVRTPGQHVLPAAEAEVLAGFQAVLAEMLKLEPEAVDPEQPFRAFGFDSMLTVAFVAALNSRYGLGLSPAVLLEHPTLGALARHVSGETGPPRPERATDTRPAAAPAPVIEELRRQLAGLLHQAPERIDAEAAFAALGLDSLLAAEFLAGVNHTYALAEDASVLHDHPSLAALAAHVASLASPAFRASSASPEPPAPVDLEALLDAVREDVLSVDEAVALLAARA
ncbi:phosphopantetheine-binding protein [Streptomyces sp. NPDC006739]|uniref:phosphopantetheine-binding protein n=1 Tax=Streptomyces sp. NPDC006739 TaxID=3364763 RepID=UPI0036AF2B16